MSRPWFAIVVLVSVVGIAVSAPPGFSETLRLRPGFQRILDFAQPRRLSIGNPEIIEARPLPRKDGILVVGKHEGETDLVIWGPKERREWTVTVADESGTDAQEARSLAALFPDVRVAQAGSSIVIGGIVWSERDKALLEAFARTHRKVHLRVDLPRDRKTLLSYDLKIIELSKGETSHLGVRWPDTVSARSAISHGTAEATSVTIQSDVETGLNLLMADGRARILANPKLVCENGGSADFLAGGEIPIVIVTPETRTVEWKTYGIILKLKPTLEEGNRIRTRITAEISTVDHGSGSSDVPGLLTRRVSTDFVTPPGSTVMLSGLVKNETAKDVAKVPLLGQIPILGELFKSRSFRENRSELAVFITPTEVRRDSEKELTTWEHRAVTEERAMRLRLLD